MVTLFSKTPPVRPFEQFFGEISLRLLRADATAPKSSIKPILSDIGERYGVDRVHLRWAPVIDSDTSDEPLPMVAGWERGDGGPGEVFTVREVPWCLAKIRSGEAVRFDDRREMPDEASADKLALEARGIRALLAIGLTLDDSMLGAFSMSSRSPYHWSDQTEEEVRALAAILTNYHWSINNRLKLRDNEARYRGIVQDQMDLIVRWTPDCVTNWVNERVCDYLQVPREELIGKTGNVLIPDTAWPNLQEDIAALTPESPTKDDEWEMTLPNGERVWQEWTDRGIFDAEGTLLEIQSVGRDITERKMAESSREHEAAFQWHKAELLISLTTLRKDDADVTIRRVLEEIGDLFGAARIGVWWLSEEKESVTCTNSWFEEGAPQPPFPFTVSRADYQWVFDLLLSGKKLLFRDVDEVPASANELRGFMEKTQIRSYLACPLVVDGEDMGSITIAATRADAWNDIAIGELEILANILATALSRFHASEALSRRAAFQSRLAETSSILLNVPSEKTTEAIADALALIGDHYGFDRVNVTWYDEALPGFGAPIDWQPEGTKIGRADPEEFPYGYGVMLRGGVTRVDAVDEMPAAASIDQATWKRLGLSTVLCLPLVIKEKVFGSTTFAYRKQQDWQDQKVEELRLFANIVTNCAVRQWSTIQLTRREKDLERSQRVAKVGSYRLQATFNDDDSEALLNVLNFNMSDQALEIFGVQPQSDARAQVMSTLARIHPDDEPRVRETWQGTLREGGEHTIEYRVIGPEGSTVHVQAKEQFDGTDENGVTTFFGTYKDITEWVEANSELQLALSQIQKLTDQLQEENVLLRDEVRAAHGFDKIIGTSSKLRGVLKAVQQVAPTDVTVLICGETGTGKELIAQSIHDLSDRKAMPMVSVNCAALSAELIESELFGHEKGAFTGAHARRKGRFEITNGGTLFLDEIGEMSGDLQAKLLRVIQEGEFERLGGSTTLKTDVRLIAATNRNLVQELDSGRFRADLYYRINAFPVELPPLRERKEDIPLLAAHLVRKHAKILGKEVTSMSARMLRNLQEQDWPGNIRELEGTILRALISTTGPVLDLDGGRMNGEAAANTSDSLSLLDAQRKHVVEVLERTRWIIEGEKGAAAALGLAPSSLRSKMKRLNIVRPSRERAS